MKLLTQAQGSSRLTPSSRARFETVLNSAGVPAAGLFDRPAVTNS